MINLISREQKKSFIKGYRKHFAIVCLLLLFTSIMIGSILLTPAYLAYTSKLESLQKSIETVLSLRGSGEETNTDYLLKDIQKKISILGSREKRFNPTDTIDQILLAKKNEISITSLAFTEKGGKKILEVKGVALTRGALIAFVEALEKNESFSKVNLPVAQFIKEEDLDFNIEITMDG